MTHPHYPLHVHLSDVHCGAVCQEMGERLSLALGPQSSDLPPALLGLIEQLAKEENANGDRRFSRPNA